MNKGLKVDIEDLSLVLGNNTILENINISFEEAKIHCIIGPNGGGKTSLIKCILGQLAFSGNINLVYDDEYKISYVPQKLNYEKTLPITVEDFLMLIYQKKPAFMGIAKNNKKYFDEILGSVGLLEKRKRLLGDLSGGELQRLLLAQAINPMPNLLILDEPFTGIDSLGEEYFINKIKELKDKGVTILWIHHNIRQVKDIADTVTCIKKQIKFTGKANEVLSENNILDIYI